MVGDIPANAQFAGSERHMSPQPQADELRDLTLHLPDRHYLRLIWLKALLSRKRNKAHSIEETIGFLLDREDRVKQIKLWLYTGLIFLAITAVLFLPFGASLKAVFILGALGIILGLVSFYWLTPESFKKISPVTNAKIVMLMEKLSQRAGLKNPPRLMILETPEVNALAVSGRESSIVLTRGLIDAYSNGLLIEDELGAIIGHELGHLKHRDGLRRSLAYSWISIFSAGGEWITQIGISVIAETQAEQSSGLSSVAQGLAGLMMSSFGLFAKFLAKMASALYFHLSRRQEYEADDMGAQLTHPNAMASALKKIEELNVALVQRELQQLPFPDLWQVKPKRLSLVDRLWTTHPPTDERIARQTEFAQFI